MPDDFRINIRGLIPGMPGIPGMPKIPGKGGENPMDNAKKQANKLLSKLEGGAIDYNGDGRESTNEKRAFTLADRDHDGKLSLSQRKLRASFDTSRPKDREFSNAELAAAAKAIKASEMKEDKGHDAKHGARTKGAKARD